MKRMRILDLAIETLLRRNPLMGRYQTKAKIPANITVDLGYLFVENEFWALWVLLILSPFSNQFHVDTI